MYKFNLGCIHDSEKNHFKKFSKDDVFPFKKIEKNKITICIGSSNQAECLLRYLKNEDIDAKTCVVEDGYVDKEYLIDYQRYYSRSFKDIDRYTKRIHFFSKEFSYEEFIAVLNGKNPKYLEKYYLGFTVIKLVPDQDCARLIGKTVLKTYDKYPRDGKRHFICKKHKVSLFGIPLEIHSLPFQAQDNAVSACATIALWSAINPLSSRWGIIKRSPAEITEIATNYPSISRKFPSDGLKLEQVGHYIRSNGLECESVRLDETNNYCAMFCGLKSSFKSPQLTEQQEKELDNLKLGDLIDIQNELISAVVKAYVCFGIPILAFLKHGNVREFNYENLSKKDSKNHEVEKKRFLEFIEDQGVEWVKYAHLDVSGNSKTITIIKNKNSAVISLDENEKELMLDPDDGSCKIKMRIQDNKICVFVDEERHAVAISGYRCDTNRKLKNLFVHDDQICPFSRVCFKNKENNKGKYFKFWDNEWKSKGYNHVELTDMIVPIYHKLRLKFELIFSIYLGYKINCLIKNNILKEKPDRDMELLLFRVQEYKEFLFKGEYDKNTFYVENKEDILTTQLPHFLWVLRTYEDKLPKNDLVYDATESSVKGEDYLLDVDYKFK